MYTLKELLYDIEYEADPSVDLDSKVINVTADSKKILPGSIFVCFKGMKNNAFNFADDALNRGCIAIICEKQSNISINSAIYVSNARSAHAKLVSKINGRPDKRIKLIGITGTNGKTTVTHMISAALNSCGKKTALLGTLGGYFQGARFSTGTMTTPDPETLYPILNRFAAMGAEYAVMEVSSHALALSKIDGLELEIGAVTNITPEHLDFHENMKNYCAAKKKLLTLCKKTVICIDDNCTKEIAESTDITRLFTCSQNNNRCDFFATDISFKGISGCSFTVRHSDGGTRISSPIPGDFSVQNALVAFSVLTSLGISSASAAKGISSLKSVRGRMEMLQTYMDFDVIIDFAHTPDALEKLLKSVRTFCPPGRRIVTLFGCGGDRDKSKRATMGTIASMLSDLVCITSDNSRNEDNTAIINQIKNGISNNCPFICIPDRRNAIEYVIQNALPGDMILLCGKGHEEYEIDRYGIHPFSERKIVEETIEKMKRARK